MAFFSRTCPIGDAEVQATLYHSVYGVAAAVKESDWQTFGNAISTIQDCAWKGAERAEYNGQIKKIERNLYDAGATCVGMSSLGPALFFFSNDLVNTMKSLEKHSDYLRLLSVFPRNHGRTLVYA
jgi:beta-ribofuranosylaminobenzene 5'-phosphate synthase